MSACASEMCVIGLTKEFGPNKILDAVSFEVPKGGSVLIQGPSGCGKTTLLRCMALLEPIQSGRIEFGGRTVLTPGHRPCPARNVRLQIAMVFQQLYLWPHLTVLENILLPLRLLSSADGGTTRHQALAILNFLGIAEKEDDYPVSLSGGQQQRVALARALVHSPKILLLDEITANLDKDTSCRVLEAVQEILKRGTATVIVSHAPWIPPALQQAVLRRGADGWSFTQTEKPH